MIESYLFFNLLNWGCHGYDRMVVGFTTTCSCEFEPCVWRGVLDTTYVIKFVRDMRQASGFLRFPPPINKPDHHDITEILLKVAFNTITHPYFDLSSSSLYNLISDINTLSDLHRIGSYNFNSISSTPLCLF